MASERRATNTRTPGVIGSRAASRPAPTPATRLDPRSRARAHAHITCEAGPPIRRRRSGSPSSTRSAVASRRSIVLRPPRPQDESTIGREPVALGHRITRSAAALLLRTAPHAAVPLRGPPQHRWTSAPDHVDMPHPVGIHDVLQRRRWGRGSTRRPPMTPSTTASTAPGAGRRLRAMRGWSGRRKPSRRPSKIAKVIGGRGSRRSLTLSRLDSGLTRPLRFRREGVEVLFESLYLCDDRSGAAMV
jgi:hypothetical protein